MFVEILFNPFFILTILRAYILFAETWPYLPDCLQMPVNGNIDGETGGFQEVGEEVPFDHPRLGDAHLFAAHLFRLFDFLTSSWDEEREEESAVQEFNIASWLPKPLLAFCPFFYNTGLVFKNCAGRNCPPCQSWCWYEYDSKLPACSNVFLVCHEKLNRSPGLSAISTCSYPSWHSALRIPNVLFASVGRPHPCC